MLRKQAHSIVTVGMNGPIVNLGINRIINLASYTHN